MFLVEFIQTIAATIVLVLEVALFVLIAISVVAMTIKAFTTK